MTTHKTRGVGRARAAVVTAFLSAVAISGASAEPLQGSAGGTGTASNPSPRPPMSADQQIAMAKRIVARGQDLAQRLMRMVDEARREGDMVRFTCLNDKLTQVNTNVNTAQSRVDALAKAPDAESRGHEFTVITVVGQKLQTLDQEAGQCLGQDLYEAGVTKKTTTIDNDSIPFEPDPSSPPTLLPPGVPSLPARASGIK